MTTHSPIGASGMSRWSKCPGSVRESRGLESRSSKEALEGTAAHTLAERCLSEEVTPHSQIGKEIAVGNGDSIRLVQVTQDMADAVEVYVDFVAENVPQAIRHSPNFLVEHSFDLGALHQGLFGTADLVVFYPDEKKLMVVDYKHGVGVPVEVKDNPQLMYYALGALVTTGFPAEEVEMVIVQPRCHHSEGPIRRRSIPALELLEFAADLIEYAKATEDPDAPLHAGSHCRWCPAAGKPCKELERIALETAQREFSPTLSYDPQHLADTLAKLPTLEAFIKTVREFAYGEAEHGRNPPGWKLVEKRATRKWRNESEAEDALAEAGLLPDEIYEEPSLKSPAQVEKLLAKADRGLLNDLVVKESSGYTLAPDSDKRDAVKKDAASEFSAVT